jgi:hypothetical protein
MVNLVLGLLALSCIPLAFVVARAYFRFRGTRLITCPETRMPAAVRLDERHAALSSALGEPDLRLTSCSRWPERQDCGLECLSQIEEAPEDCLVRNVLARWYQGRSCALCDRPFGEIHLTDHRPALLTPGGRTIEWSDVAPETLPAVLATHRRVCWNCHIATTFRTEFPDLVTDRPFRKAS